MILSKELDWIQMTFHYQTYPFRVLPQHEMMEIVGFGKKLFGVYDVCYSTKSGGLIMWNNENEHQGIHVLFAGQTLQTLRQNRFTSNDVLDMARGARNIARLDYAITTSLFTMEQVEQTIDRGNYSGTTPMNCKIFAGSENGGITYYFGSPKSDKRVVLYDKAKEMGLLSEALSRVELRLRNRYSTQFVDNSVKIPYAILGDNMIKRTVNIEMKGYSQALDNQANVEFNMLPQKEDGFSSWLNGQVRKAIENRLADRREAIERFFKWLDDTLGTNDTGI